MEVLPVTPEESQELTKESLQDFSNIAIKQYAYPKAADNTYRVFTADGKWTDVEAENASHAYQLADRKDVVKIARVEFSHNDFIAKDEVIPTGKDISPAITEEEKACLIAAFEERAADPEFSALGFQQLADSYRK